MIAISTVIGESQFCPYPTPFTNVLVAIIHYMYRVSHTLWYNTITSRSCTNYCLVSPSCIRNAGLSGVNIMIRIIVLWVCGCSAVLRFLLAIQRAKFCDYLVHLSTQFINDSSTHIHDPYMMFSNLLPLVLTAGAPQWFCLCIKIMCASAGNGWFP